MPFSLLMDSRNLDSLEVGVALVGHPQLSALTGSRASERLHSLLLSIRAIYLPASSSAYHNFAHGVDVLQSTYYFLQEIGLAPPFSWILSSSSDRSALPWRRGSSASGRAAEVIRPQDVLALLLAAIGHDVAHPGLSNALMVSTLPPSPMAF